MRLQAFRNPIQRGELIGVAVLIVIGVSLIMLAPAKQLLDQPSAIAAPAFFLYADLRSL
jgi:hypothetical protein